MSKIKKHTDIVNSYAEFEENVMNGFYEEPWVVYIKNDDGTYEIKYSNDVNRTHVSATPDIVDILEHRLRNLENEKIFCYEEEYDNLVTNGEGWITDINGERKYITFDENVLYHIYEEEGPSA